MESWARSQLLALPPGRVKEEKELAAESAAYLVAWAALLRCDAPAMATGGKEFFPEPAAGLALRVWLVPASSDVRSGPRAHGQAPAVGQRESRRQRLRARRKKRSRAFFPNEKRKASETGRMIEKFPGQIELL